jgi:hypothetical protein
MQMIDLYKKCFDWRRFKDEAPESEFKKDLLSGRWINTDVLALEETKFIQNLNRKYEEIRTKILDEVKLIYAQSSADKLIATKEHNAKVKAITKNDYGSMIGLSDDEKVECLKLVDLINKAYIDIDKKEAEKLIALQSMIGL